MMSSFLFRGIICYAISEESYFGIIIPIGGSTGLRMVLGRSSISSNLTSRENRSEEPG